MSLSVLDGTAANRITTNKNNHPIYLADNFGLPNSMPSVTLDDDSTVSFRSISVLVSFNYHFMATPFLALAHHHKIFTLFCFSYLLFSVHGLSRGSSLSVDNKNDILVSADGRFTAGFHEVGDNAYCFAVWFTDQPTKEDPTVVWMANRDAPVNGKYSKLSLLKNGNLVLIDADEYIIWSTNTKSNSSKLELRIDALGSLVLRKGDHILWQSFDYPTDTLLPGQKLTKNSQLVSSRSFTNYSSGFYKLFFDIDGILRLHYEGPKSSSVYWPDPDFLTWQLGRYQYEDILRAAIYDDGKFFSTDGFQFWSADSGFGPQRMVKIDIDGNLRVYSLIEHQGGKKWEVQWQAISHSCRVHGICGPNSLCSYSQNSGRKCSCLHGHKMENDQDWSYGCKHDFLESCLSDRDGFIKLDHVEFYGYDVRFHLNYTLEACKKDCLNDCNCKGFQFAFDHDRGTFNCSIKSYLNNGCQMRSGKMMYIKLPKILVSSFIPGTSEQSNLSCVTPLATPITRSYNKKNDNKLLNILAVLGCAIGFIEIVGIIFFWYNSSKHSITTEQSYFPASTMFRKFTYSELKKASRNFSQEIGRGGTGVVYKGTLSDNRVAAIKKLKNINHQREHEFQAEISTIGRLNHMNLIETWGYCAEGKRRLIVYEYMENGSLADNLGYGTLNWETLLRIAKGTAKGLAYLHEECLEWVLHCDVKPHNILLDGDYNPKVADFGLSKLFDRDRIGKSNFSTVRGTRGYMAPEWVFNLPITSKVDVFSYGVVILEMITGRSPAVKQQKSQKNGDTEPGLVEWVKDMIKEVDGSGIETWVEKIVNPMISGEYDPTIMQNLVRIAVECADEDMKMRPFMKEVVNMLLH